jgi:FMN-dependent NADH-azoreductase
MYILHLDSSLSGANSVSRKLSAAIVERLHALHPDADIVERDLAPDPALHLNGTHMSIRMGLADDVDLRDADIVEGNRYLRELQAADVVVIGAPMYNLSIPTPLKAWIDRVVVAGATFRYTPAGPEGLLKGKKVYIASARGSVYPAGSPAAALDHQEAYLRAIWRLLGVTDIEIVRAEGVATRRDATIAGALAAIAAIEA